jgi:hypothetical protein
MSTETNIFERAARSKIRFATNKGMLTAEDLWDLPLTSDRSYVNLDDLARSLNRQLKNEQDESFVEDVSHNNLALKLSFDLVKHVIDVKLEERDLAKSAAERRKSKARILEIIESKQDQELSSKSLEELTALAAAL